MTPEQRTKEELLDAAVRMLAEWTLAVELNGSGWDDWDEYYKNAAYRPGRLRELIDAERERLKRDDPMWREKADES